MKRRPVEKITDRAKRYRANQDVAAGPAVCGYCGSTQSMGVDHIDGDESHGDSFNLIWACKPCNMRKAHVLAAAGMGRPTNQYNPARGRGARDISEWARASDVLRGYARGDVGRAVRTVQATPPALRRQFGARLQRNPGADSSGQYFSAVNILRGVMPGDKQKARELIDATPSYRRSQYTREAWRTRKEVYGPSGRSQGAFGFSDDEVPF